VFTLVEIDHVTRWCLSSAGDYQRIVPVFAIFAQNLPLYIKNNRVLLSHWAGPTCHRFPRKFDVQTSYKLSNYVLVLIFVVNIKFPRATYHTIVPSTEELCWLINVASYYVLSLLD